MDRQVSKINKSDFRDELRKCHEEGKEAYRNSEYYTHCPYIGDKGNEWKVGWCEEDDVEQGNLSLWRDENSLIVWRD